MQTSDMPNAFILHRVYTHTVTILENCDRKKKTQQEKEAQQKENTAREKSATHRHRIRGHLNLPRGSGFSRSGNYHRDQSGHQFFFFFYFCRYNFLARVCVYHVFLGGLCAEGTSLCTLTLWLSSLLYTFHAIPCCLERGLAHAMAHASQVQKTSAAIVNDRDVAMHDQCDNNDRNSNSDGGSSRDDDKNAGGIASPAATSSRPS